MPAVACNARAWHNIEELVAKMDQVGCSQKLRFVKNFEIRSLTAYIGQNERTNCDSLGIIEDHYRSIGT